MADTFLKDFNRKKKKKDKQLNRTEYSTKNRSWKNNSNIGGEKASYNKVTGINTNTGLPLSNNNRILQKKTGQINSTYNKSISELGKGKSINRYKQTKKQHEEIVSNNEERRKTYNERAKEKGRKLLKASNSFLGDTAESIIDKYGNKQKLTSTRKNPGLTDTQERTLEKSKNKSEQLRNFSAPRKEQILQEKLKEQANRINHYQESQNYGDRYNQEEVNKWLYGVSGKKYSEVSKELRNKTQTRENAKKQLEEVFSSADYKITSVDEYIDWRDQNNIPKLDEKSEKALREVEKNTTANDSYISWLKEYADTLKESSDYKNDIKESENEFNSATTRTEQDEAYKKYMEAKRNLQESEYNNIPENIKNKVYNALVNGNEKEAKEQLKEQGYSTAKVNMFVGIAKRQLNTNRAYADTQTNIEIGKKHPVMGSIASIGGNLIGGAIGTADILSQGLSNAVTSEEYKLPIDFNTDALRLARTGSEYRQGATDDIDSEAGKLIYNALMSAADSTVAAMAGQSMAGIAGMTGASAPVVASLMSAQAFQSTSTEMHNRGISDKQAIAGGMVAAVFEQLFENIPLDKIFKMSTTPKNMGEVIKNITASMGIEGTEELFTTVANDIYDTLANGDLSEFALIRDEYIRNGATKGAADWYAISYMSKGALEDGLAGAIAGFGISGISQVNSYSRQSGLREYGRNILNSNSIGSIEQFVNEEYGKDSKLNRQMSGINKENATEVGYFASSVILEEDNSAKYAYDKAMRPAVKERLVNLGVKENAAENIASNIIYNTKISDEVKSEYNRQIKQVKREISQGMKGKETGDNTWFHNVDLNEYYRHSTNRDNLLRIAQGKKVQSTTEIENETLADAKNKVEKLKKEGRTSGDGTVTYEDGSSGKYEGIKISENGETVVIADGKEYNEEEVTVDENTALLIECGNYYTPEQRENFFKGYEKGSSLLSSMDYATAFAEAFRCGAENKGLRSAVYNDAVSKILNDNQIMLAYSAGKVEYNEKVIAQKKKALIQNRKKNPGKVFMETSKKLDNTQKAAVKVAEIISKATGVNITFYESKADSEGRYTEENGSYDLNTNSIRIDINAGKLTEQDSNNIMIITLAHELTHHMEQFAPEEYAKLEEFVFEKLQVETGVNIEVLIRQEMKKKDSKGKNLTRNVARSELVARGCELMLTDTKIINELAKRDSGLFGKVKAKITELTKAIEKACEKVINGEKVSESVAEEARLLKNYANKMSVLWNNALREAGENEQVVYKDSESKLFSIRQFQNGKKFVEVDIDQHIFEGKDRSQYSRIAKEIITNKFQGKVIGEVGKNAYINAKSKGEYVNPRKPIKQNYVYDSKMKAASELDNLLEVSEFIENKPDGKDGHFHENNIGGFDYYKTLFRVDGRFFEGIINIEITNRGRLFKDITKIKDVTEVNSVQYGKYHKTNASETSSINSISNNSQNSNTKLKQSRDTSGRILTEAQKEYFKNSKVRDENGNLKVVYHGTNREFNIFDLDQARGTEDIEAFFFTENIDESGGYGKYVRPYYLNITKPADYDTAYGIFHKYKGKAGAGIKTREELQALGYDGVIAEDEDAPEYTEYLAFSPEQIKLVTNENPTEEVDIRYQSRNYSYEELTNKPPMKVLTVNNVDYSKYESRSDILDEAMNNLKNDPDVVVNEEIALIHNYDSDVDIEVSRRRLRHGIARRASDAAKFVTLNIGNAIKYGIKVNEAEGKRSDADKSSVFMGKLIDIQGQEYYYRLIVNETTEGDYEINRLYAAKAKKKVLGGNAPTPAGINTAKLNTFFDLKISDFLNEVKDYYGESLSEDVNNHFDRERGKSDIEGLLYQDRQTQKTYGYSSEQNEKYKGRLTGTGEVVKDTNGNDVVIISNKLFPRRKLANNQRYKLVREQVEKMLQELSGHYVIIKENNKTVYFDNVFADEYTNSGDSIRASIPKKNVKMNSISEMVSIIENAKYINHSDLNKTKKKVDAIGGFDYYNVRFAISTGDKEYVVYSGILNVRIDKQDNCYAYDITKLSADYGSQITGYKPLSADSDIKTQADNIVKDENILTQDRKIQKYYEAALRENKKYQEAIENLRAQFKLTRGHKVGAKGITRLTSKLIKDTNSAYDRTELKRMLSETFDVIVANKLDADEALKRIKKITYKALSERRENTKRSDYAEDLLKEFRTTRIRLSDTQKSEIEYTTGLTYEEWRKRMFGKILLTDKGMPLDSKWSEWSAIHPEIFGENLQIADQPAMLEDIIEKLQNSYEDNYGFDIDEAAEFYATELMAEYVSLPEVTTYADRQKAKFDRQQEKYNEKIAELKKEYFYKYKAEKLEAQKTLDEARKEWKKEQREREERLRIEYANRLIKYKNRDTSARNTREKELIRNRIIRQVKSISSQLINPTDQKHIPEGFKGEAARFCQMFINNTSVFKYDDLDRLKVAYAAMSKEETELAGRYDEDIESMMEVLKTKLDGKRLSQLDRVDLEIVRDIVDHIYHIIKTENEIFINGRQEQIFDVGSKALNELETKGTKEIWRTNSEGINRFADNVKEFWVNNTTPIYYFKELGNTFSRLYKDIRAGQSKCAKNVAKAKSFIQKTKKECHYDKWDLTKEVKIGGNISLDVEQAMYLYATAKREKNNAIQDASHLKTGGIILEEITQDKKEVLHKAVRQKKGYSITPGDLAKIEQFLTSEQKTYADRMVRYLSDDMAELGNETSMELYGIKKYNERYYFPYKVAQSELKTDATERKNVQPNLKNKPFTKLTTKKANNAIVIGNFTETAAEHMYSMCLYNAMAVAQDNLNRVYNFKDIRFDKNEGEKVGSGITMKQLLKNTMGTEYVKYMDNFLQALNGGLKADGTTGLINSLIGKHKKSAVYASASVAIQQPSAICRAMAVIDPKYFAETAVSKRDWEECKQYNGVAVIKEIGGFDTGTGKGVVDYMVGPKSDDRLVKVLQITDETLGKLPEIMDELTWCHIWNACKEETKSKYGFKGKEAEFFHKASERFDDVINLTQVYDSVLAKSANMNSKDVAMKMFTSFMTEPTVSINMLTDAIRSKNRKYTGKIVAVLVTQVIVNAALKALVQAARNSRDDDEDKSYVEKYVKEFSENVVGDRIFGVIPTGEINPATWIPGLRDIISIFQGYDVERTDMALISELISGFETLGKIREGKYNKTIYDAVMEICGPIAALYGIPVKNLMKDVRGVRNVITDVIDNNILPTNAENLRKAFFEGMGIETNMTDEVAKYLRERNPDTLNKLIADKEKEIKDSYPAYSKGKAEQQAKTLVKAGITKELKKTYINGDRKEREEVIAIMKESGMYMNGEEDISEKTATKWEVEELKKRYISEPDSKERNEIRRKLYNTKYWKSLRELDEQLKKWTKGE